MAEGKWVSATDLGLDHKQARATISRSTLQEARAELEKRLIREALDASGQTVQAAARRLGISRMTFYRMLERYGLSTEKSAEGSVVPASPDEGAHDD
jgi:DNA-binding NtrC family response regulator